MKERLLARAVEIATTGVAILVVVGFGWLVVPILLSPPTKETAYVNAAAVAVVGVIVTAAVTLLGLLFKRTADRRLLELTSQAHRTSELELQRQKTEVALETIKLLPAGTDEKPTNVQASAALIVLAKLGELVAALSLAAELWPRDMISSSTGVKLVELAFGGDDDSHHNSAAVLLYHNVPRLDRTGSEYEWPDCFEEWRPELPDGIRDLVIATLVRWCKLRPPAREDDLRVNLLKAARSDPSARIATMLNSSEVIGWLSSA